MYLNYTLGKLMILKLRTDWRAKLGAAFDCGPSTTSSSAMATRRCRSYAARCSARAPGRCSEPRVETTRLRRAQTDFSALLEARSYLCRPRATRLAGFRKAARPSRSKGPSMTSIRTLATLFVLCSGRWLSHRAQAARSRQRPGRRGGLVGDRRCRPVRRQWTEAAAYFRGASTRRAGSGSWVRCARLSGSSSRGPSSRPRRRPLLPGAPDGEYVVFQFDTSFERKGTAVETVTVSKETDGAWRVSGYYIK